MPKKSSKKFKKVKEEVIRPLPLKTEGQEYAQVTKALGDCRVMAKCFDGKERICHIRGSMMNKVRVFVDDIILIGIRDFQDNKADVILKYSADECKRLKKMGELPSNLQQSQQSEEPAKSDDAFEFDSI